MRLVVFLFGRTQDMYLLIPEDVLERGGIDGDKLVVCGGLEDGFGFWGEIEASISDNVLLGDPQDTALRTLEFALILAGFFAFEALADNGLSS